MITTYKSRAKQARLAKPEVSSAKLTYSSSSISKARAQVSVEIPHSPLHRNSAVRTLPSATPVNNGSNQPGIHMGNQASATPTMLSARKRKLEVFVEIPPSPLHRSTPSTTPRNTGVNSSVGSSSRRLIPFVEIPPSPFHSKGLKLSASKFSLSSGAMRSPLLSKVINSDPRAGNEAPFKKLKQDGLSQDAKGTTEKYPNGGSMCHQCHRKVDNLDGVRCTTTRNNKCRLMYCNWCLRGRYEQDAHAIRRHVTAPNLRRVPEEQYIWTCPRCEGACNCHACRRAKGLPLLGAFYKGKNFEAQPPQSSLPKPFFALTPHETLKFAGVVPPPMHHRFFHFVQPKHTPTPVIAQPVKPVRAKKVVPEPKWIQASTSLSHTEAEDRFYLRESILRFAPLMNIAAIHLEDLDLYETMSDACAKAILVNLLDLIAVDIEGEEQKTIKEAIKRINSSSLNAGMLWPNIALLRKSLSHMLPMAIPDPSPRPPPSSAPIESEFIESEARPLRKSTRIIKPRNVLANLGQALPAVDLSVTDSIQLIPPLVALCEWAGQGQSVREEIETGMVEAREANRRYWAAVREENERWTAQRTTFGLGEDKGNVPGDKNDKRSADDKSKGRPKFKDPETERAYQAALAAHKKSLADLLHANELVLQGGAPRFSPLGPDAQGRVYYAASAHRRSGKRAKVPSDEDRDGMTKWGWFLAVWTAGDATSEKSDKEKKWFGFSNPAEIRQLAKWIAATESLDLKDADVDDVMHSNDEQDTRECRPSRGELKVLVKNLNEYADLLAWRIAGGAEQ